MNKKRLSVAIAMPPQAQSLDVSGPLAVFREATRQLPGEAGYEVRLVSTLTRKQIFLDGICVLADASIYDDFATDTLLVAGTPAYAQATEMPAFTQWLQRYTAHCRRYGSVCTGAFFLAAAGLLNGRQVTTHWQQAEELAQRYPLTTVHSDDIFVQDEQLFTSAGVTAGIDLCLKLVEDDYGRELALSVARELVVFLHRPGGQSQFSTHLAAQMTDDSKMRSMQKWILAHLDRSLSLPVLAEQANMSVRNFSRVFRQASGHTPADYVELARVDEARRLLDSSDLALQRIASRCGFTNVDLMRRAFIRRTGINPSEYRQRFSRQH